VDREKWLKEIQLSVGLVRNLSVLNGDVGITGLVILNFRKQIVVYVSWFTFRFTL
jgi:hypothetical protein